MASLHRPKIPRGRRQTVYRRDNWTCQDCGLRFDPSRTWNPASAAPYTEHDRLGFIFLELDHIHPRVLGGPDTVENLRALCTICNRRKSFKPSKVVA